MESAGPRGIAAFAPNRSDLPTMYSGAPEDSGEENDEPVFGRVTLKKLSKDIVDGRQVPSLRGQAGTGSRHSQGYGAAHVAPRPYACARSVVCRRMQKQLTAKCSGPPVCIVNAGAVWALQRAVTHSGVVSGACQKARPRLRPTSSIGAARARASLAVQARVE